MCLDRKSGCVLFQVITNPLTVDEGGECWIGPEHLLLSDMDSMEEDLQVELQKEPQNGALQLGGRPLKPGHAFTVQDLKSLKVRSDILFRKVLNFYVGFIPKTKILVSTIAALFDLISIDCNA